MISFSCLPSDIIYEVAKYISIRDVCILSHASVDLYFKVKGLQTNIIIYNFKKHNKLYNVSEIEMIFERFSNVNSIELIIDLFLEDNIDKINKLYEILEKKENGLNLFLGKISALNPKDIFNIWLNVEKLRLDFDILNIESFAFSTTFFLLSSNLFFS